MTEEQAERLIALFSRFLSLYELSESIAHLDNFMCEGNTAELRDLADRMDAEQEANS